MCCFVLDMNSYECNPMKVKLVGIFRMKGEESHKTLNLRMLFRLSANVKCPVENRKCHSKKRKRPKPYTFG